MHNIGAYSGTELKEKPVPWLIIVTQKTIEPKEQAMNNEALITTEEQSSWCYASDMAPRT